MNTTTTAALSAPGRIGGGLAGLLANTATITGRNLHRLVRVPTLIVFATLQPVMFVLLFTYAFGGAIHPPGVDRYVDYLLPGIFVLAIADDLASGMIDRFRALPMARAAVLAGRTVADALRNLFVLGLMIGVGAAIGFRFHARPRRRARHGGPGPCGRLRVLLEQRAAGPAGPRRRIRRPGRAAGGHPAHLFTSSTFVPVATMPGWLQAFAKLNPITVTVDALRALCLGGPPPPTSGRRWHGSVGSW
jgi:ABC-2 type transport system permease protein/oleandomycin transport system permease protein